MHAENTCMASFKKKFLFCCFKMLSLGCMFWGAGVGSCFKTKRIGRKCRGFFPARKFGAPKTFGWVFRYL